MEIQTDFKILVLMCLLLSLCTACGPDESEDEPHWSMLNFNLKARSRINLSYPDSDAFLYTSVEGIYVSDLARQQILLRR